MNIKGERMYYNTKNEKIVYMETEPARKHSRLNVFLAGTTMPNPDYAVCHNETVVHELSRFQFEYVTAGKGYVEIGGTTYTVRAGDLFFINKWSPNLYYTDKNDLLEKEFITVSGSLVEGLVQIYQLHSAFLSRRTDALDIFRQIHQALSQIEFLGRDKTFEKVEFLLLQLIQKLAAEPFSLAEKNISTPEAMLEYIHHHLETKFTLEDMSQYFFLSKAQLIRIFKARYHITPIQYVILKRIETSMYLLENSNLSIKDIAERLAFSDSKHYTKTFTRLTGVAPIKYRKQIAENRKQLLSKAMGKL